MVGAVPVFVEVSAEGAGQIEESGDVLVGGLRRVDVWYAGFAGGHGVHGVVYDSNGVGHRLALVFGDDEYCNAAAGQVLLVRDPLIGGDQQLVSVAFSLVQQFAVSERVPVALKGGVPPGGQAGWM